MPKSKAKEKCMAEIKVIQEFEKHNLSLNDLLETEAHEKVRKTVDINTYRTATEMAAKKFKVRFMYDYAEGGMRAVPKKSR